LQRLSSKQRETILSWFDCKRFTIDDENVRKAANQLKGEWRKDTLSKNNLLSTDKKLGLTKLL